MIQANELRIGNWVFLHQGFDSIKYDIQAHDIEELYDNDGIGVAPIPITEEDLLECGFEKKEQRFESKEALLRISYFDSAWHCSIGDDDFGILFRTIKHLHQLQNLYFALTGKELEIEL